MVRGSPAVPGIYGTFLLPVTRDITKRMRKMTKQILAIVAAIPARPPKPSSAATSAIIRKMIVLFNIRGEHNALT